MRSKRYKKLLAEQDIKASSYPLKEALEIVKKTATANFAENVDISIKLGIKKQKEQFVIRGSVELPHYKAKAKKMIAFVDDEEKDLIKNLKGSGVSEAGGEKLIERVAKDKKLDAEQVVAVPTMMPKLGKIAKIIGPKGLMPSPKTGTISNDILSLVKKLSEGNQVEIRNDKNGIIHTSVGKVSQKTEELEENINKLLDFISKQKPENWKGEYIVKTVISSTMGPGVKVEG